MPNLNKDQRKRTNKRTTATTKRNDDSKKEGRIRQSKLFSTSCIMEKKITHPVLLNNFYVDTYVTHKEKERIFDLSRFYASDSSYNKQKQTRIMAPFASHTEA